MKFHHVILILNITLIFTAMSIDVACANGGLTEEFKTSGLTIPRLLSDRGYKKIGDLRIEKFMSAFDTVSLNQNSEIEHKQMMATQPMTRDSAEWHRTSHGADISINDEMWPSTGSGLKPALALHEYLGALGYTDDIYSCSTSLWVLTHDDALKTLRPAEIKKIEAIAQGACKLAGGSTGVSGGGDSWGVYMKISIIRFNLKRMTPVETEKDRFFDFDHIQGQIFVDQEIHRSSH